jgi:EAL domain-containing protein (putative c-di-GMP-specific phosphodiesterase class I)/multidrug resistance efflux pump
MLLETLNSKESALLPQAGPFNSGQFELWFQPVYQRRTGTVLHNEVLLRWRDDRGNLCLPQEFLPSLSDAGSLQKLDRTVIHKAADFLAQHPDRSLSVNLSGEGLSDFALLEYIQTILDQSGVDPARLSIELTEATVARDFPTVRAFTRELKNLGCSLVLDNFANRELTLFQCQQLDLDLVKVDGQLVQRLKTDPNGRALTGAILEGIKALSPVAAKFVTDEVTLQLVEEAGLEYIQGHYLKAPSPEPEWAERVKRDEPVVIPAPETGSPALPWRLMKGAGFVLLGLAAVAAGIASISYRLNHINVDNGMLNGRTVRVQAPTEGKLEAFYARPGVKVNAGQVLARIGIEPPPPESDLGLLRLEQSQTKEQARNQLDNLELEGEIQTKSVQLEAAKQSLAALNDQLQNLERQNQTVQRFNVQLASETVNQQRAAVEAAAAEASAARSEYERYRQLVAEGAVSRQQTDEARSAWQSAEAEVKQAKAALRSTLTELNASKNGIPIDGQNDLPRERARLLQTIQEQEELVRTLEAQVASGKRQLQQAKALSGDRTLPVDATEEPEGELVREVSAPFTGVIYRTEREQGERVSESEPIVTLLDCNDVWVETVVSAEVANRIDPEKPVNVTIAGSSETLTGEIELIQPLNREEGITNQNQLRQSQALTPVIPPKWQGQLLSLISVKIPPPPQYTQSQQFCGLGQSTELTFRKKGLIGR